MRILHHNVVRFAEHAPGLEFGHQAPCPGRTAEVRRVVEQNPAAALEEGIGVLEISLHCVVFMIAVYEAETDRAAKLHRTIEEVAANRSPFPRGEQLGARQL